MSDSRIVVEFEALPAERFSGVPADVRLRQLLKVALRRLGLRCTGVRSQLELHGLASSKDPADGAEAASRESAGKVA